MSRCDRFCFTGIILVLLAMAILGIAALYNGEMGIDWTLTLVLLALSGLTQGLLLLVVSSWDGTVERLHYTYRFMQFGALLLLVLALISAVVNLTDGLWVGFFRVK